MENTLLVIGGPTAIGKTALSLELAEWLGTEIISADSRQCYREMNIGTAKPSYEELERIPHHFINSHSINEVFTAGDFSRQARSCLSELHKRYKTVICVGGSGLYLKAFTHGISDIPKSDPEIRQQLNARYSSEGLKPLQDELKLCDLQFFHNADVQNPQRVIRALEVYLSTGKPFSYFRDGTESDTLDCRVLSIGLDADRTWLYDRINQRVEEMVEQGLFKEAESLLPYREHYALQTVGYKEVFDYLDGRSSYEEAVDLIKRNTRRYAKRQLTWFRKYGEMQWFHPESIGEIKEYVTQVTGLKGKKGNFLT